MKKYGISLDIDNDWKNFKEFIKAHYSEYFESHTNFDELKRLHEKLFLLKNCIAQSNLTVNSKQDLKLSFGILLNATIMAIKGNFFNTLALARPALDAYPRALLKNKNKDFTKNFSNNIETLFKDIEVNYLSHIEYRNCFKKKRVAFCDMIKEKYWYLSDYIHLNDELNLKNHEYLSEFLPINSFDIKNQESAITNLISLVNILLCLIAFDQCYFFNDEISIDLLERYTTEQPIEFKNLRELIVK